MNLAPSTTSGEGVYRRRCIKRCTDTNNKIHFTQVVVFDEIKSRCKLGKKFMSI